MTVPFGRVLTAMVTPMLPDGGLDLPRAAELATRLVDQGNDGLIISGTTGEAPTTSRAEKAELLRVVVGAVGSRAHVVAGVGTNNTAESVELARDAEQAGAAGLLLVTPYYSKPPQAGVVAHTLAIAGSTALPLMLYDIPHRTGTALEHATLVELSQHPQVVALKDAKEDLAATARLDAACDLAIYSGSDSYNLPLLSVGAVGVASVASHIVTPQLVAMLEAWFAGDSDQARQLDAALQPVYTGLFRTQGAILSKAALALLDFPVGPLRLPLIEATPEQRVVLRADLTTAGLLP